MLENTHIQIYLPCRVVHLAVAIGESGVAAAIDAAEEYVDVHTDEGKVAFVVKAGIAITTQAEFVLNPFCIARGFFGGFVRRKSLLEQFFVRFVVLLVVFFFVGPGQCLGLGTG